MKNTANYNFKLIYESEFLSIKFDILTCILKCDWQMTTANMDSQKFKNDLLNCAELVCSCCPKGVVLDVSRFEYKMSSEEKMFFDTHIQPKITWYSASKIAALVKENNDKSQNICGKENRRFKYFDNLENAKNWLNNCYSN